MLKKSVPIIGLSAAFFTGCVSATKYKALEAESFSKSQNLSAAQKKLEEASGRLSKKEMEASEAARKIDALAKQLADLSAKTEKIEAERDAIKKESSELSARWDRQLDESLAFLGQTKDALQKRIDALSALKHPAIKPAKPKIAEPEPGNSDDKKEEEEKQ